MARRAPRPPPPLFVWHETREIERLEAERAALAKRIAGMRPRSHRRARLAIRLEELTSRVLALETEWRRDNGR